MCSALRKENKDLRKTCHNLKAKLKKEMAERQLERVVLAKHISQRIKCYEIVTKSYEDRISVYEANKLKNANHIKELQRELLKLKQWRPDAIIGEKSYLGKYLRSLALKKSRLVQLENGKMESIIEEDPSAVSVDDAKSETKH